MSKALTEGEIGAEIEIAPLAVGHKPMPLALWLATALSAGLQAAMWIAVLPAALDRDRGADLVNIFKAAALVWRGNGPRIYQASSFNHLPFEALVLSPLAPLGYAKAYLVVLAANVLLLALTLRKLRARWPWAFTLCAFMPVGIAMIDGQDSIFTLFALSAAALLLAGDRDLAAGALAGLTLYKPQIGLPICGLMFLWRRWRFVAGFALTATACVVASVATVGRHPFFSYLALLPSMGHAKYGIVVSNMVGLRGLLTIAFGGRALLIASVASSVVLLLYAFAKGRGIQAQHQLALAVAACCLANYHMLAPDLAIVLLPLAVSWEIDDGLLFASGTALFGLASIIMFVRQSLIAIPLLVFFSTFARQLSASAAASDPAFVGVRR